MKRFLVCLTLTLGACGEDDSQNLVMYDAIETTTLYECWNDPMPSPIPTIVGVDESFGTYHLYTCDDACDPIKVEIAISHDGHTFRGGVNVPADIRGCSVVEELLALVSYSGNEITITEHSVVNVSLGCDRPGTCIQDATVVGTKR